MDGNFNPLGKILIIAGIVIIAVGLLLTFFNKIPFLGKMPGDIYIKRDGFTFYFPIVTSIIISILIMLIFYIISRFRQ